MRRFNPEKELYKIQHRNRNKVIAFVSLLLVVSVISYSFALYQVRYSKRIIYTKVVPFSNKDINLAVYWDDTKSDKFPDRGSEYIYDYTKCDNGSVVEFNITKQKLNVEASGPDKCDVHFKKVHKDNSGANVPELYQGLIPIRYDNNEMYIADITKDEWYNYDNHEWANAVLIDHTNDDIVNKFYTDGKLNVGTKIEESDILQMYVWIPRYKYKLFNAIAGETAPEQMIDIKFESGTETTGTVECTIATNGIEACSGAENGEWFTHPAFKFGNTQLTGFWFGKFQSSGSNTNIKIVPNVKPITNVNLLYMFNATRNVDLQYFSNYNLNSNEIDTHLVKNMEWGAMAYLTHSKYGICTDGECVELTKNTVGYSSNAYVTGYAGDRDAWNTENGVSASTTGNMYGIYDTNGGGFEYVMANAVNSNGSLYTAASGFSSLDFKYYDAYEYSTQSLSIDQKKGHLGDATREIQKTFGVDNGGWYGDGFTYSGKTSERAYVWGIRCGIANNGNYDIAGTYSFGFNYGGAASYYSFRSVLTVHDGNS